jgi:hypothetical protein
MPSNAPRPEDRRGRILPFRRGGKPRPGISERPEQDTPVKGVEQYASVGEPDNYRQRMINNGLALGACILLVVIGVWIANTMAEMRRKEDCVLSGRRNCNPIEVPSTSPTK